MEFDMGKLEIAIEYVNRMAEGKHPRSNQKLQEDSVFNDPNVVRCMFFVEDVLKAVYENQGIVGRTAKRRIEKKPFPYEVLENFKYEEDKTITKLVAQLNGLVQGEDYEKIKYTSILSWLKTAGYLTVEHVDGIAKDCTLATKKGKEIGIYFEKKQNMSGVDYIRVSYAEEAQKFIVYNLQKILEGEVL